jgi:hypothetical protein
VNGHWHIVVFARQHEGQLAISHQRQLLARGVVNRIKLLKITGDWQKFKGLPGAEGELKVAPPKPST